VVALDFAPMFMTRTAEHAEPRIRASRRRKLSSKQSPTFGPSGPSLEGKAGSTQPPDDSVFEMCSCQQDWELGATGKAVASADKKRIVQRGH